MTNKIYNTNELSKMINEYITNYSFIDYDLDTLYNPIKYVLGMSNKRIRPILLMHSYQLYCHTIENSLPLACAIEIFHNSTLVHDDIMDDAPIRRGLETVHEKWDIQTGILAGDTMVILAYKEITKIEYLNSKSILSSFTQIAEDICKGQQLDMDFEYRKDISLNEFLIMIELKTAVFVGASMKIGALAGGATSEESELFYECGVALGLAYQLKDDVLDCYDDSGLTARQKGRDIIQGKKSALYFKFLELCTSASDKNTFLSTYHDYGLDNDQKVKRILNLYDSYGIKEEVEKLMNHYVIQYNDAFDKVNIPNFKKSELKGVINKIINFSNEWDITKDDTNLNDVLHVFETTFLKDNKRDYLDKAILFLNEIQQIPSLDTGKINQMKDELKKKQNKVVKVFISYAHTDENFKDGLNKALHALKRNKKISIWEDRQLIAGQSWESELFNKLEESELVLMILSNDYIASEFCYTKEFKKVLDSHNKKTKICIPIIAKYCSWKDLEFGSIQALPKDGKPINTYANEDLAWHEIVEAIKLSIEYFVVHDSK